jgi:SET domain-containing protein
MQLLIMPLLDFMNHANIPKDDEKEQGGSGPNVTALPYHDTVNNESFVVVKALRDIKKDEQLLVSYGKLSNNHLL